MVGVPVFLGVFFATAGDATGSVLCRYRFPGVVGCGDRIEW